MKFNVGDRVVVNENYVDPNVDIIGKVGTVVGLGPAYMNVQLDGETYRWHLLEAEVDPLNEEDVFVYRAIVRSESRQQNRWDGRMNNAQVALEAASRVHQKVTDSRGSASHYQPGVDTTFDETVLLTAQKFYDWLQDKTL